MRYDLKIESMTWSFSRISSFETCPYMWFLKYVYGAKGISKFFAQFGSYMHGIYQKYFCGLLEQDALPKYYIEHFRGSVLSSPPSKEIYRSYFEQGLRATKSPPALNRTILGVEKEFHFSYAGGRDFVGYADLITQDRNGVLYLTDHKSRALKPYSGKKVQTKSDKELTSYFRQLYVYSCPIREAYGRFPDFLEFNCFRTGTWIKEPFSIDRYHEVERWAEKQIDCIVPNEIWAPNIDYWFCKYICDMSNECEYSKML